MLGFIPGLSKKHKIQKAKERAMVKVLMVCMGNICRSPMAEGVFRRLVEDVGLAEKIFVDSAGTHSYHVGAPPDQRGQSIALRRGVDLATIRARRVEPEDIESFDYILAMDENNYEFLMDLCSTPEHQEKIRLFMEYAKELPEREVPDPYYGGLKGFERVMDLVEQSSEGLLRHIRDRYRL